jgi:hypothetical protein
MILIFLNILPFFCWYRCVEEWGGEKGREELITEALYSSNNKVVTNK